jgi:hypothetical protein
VPAASAAIAAPTSSRVVFFMTGLRVSVGG